MMLKDIEEEVARIVSPVLERESFELVDVEYRSECGRWVLRVYIDKPGGVRIEDCASISHRIEDLIDIEELITKRYSLEVSSPGLDRVVKKESDFLRFRGRTVKVVLREALQGRKNFKGKILECGEGFLDIEDADRQRHRLALGDIKKAKLEIEI